MAALAHHHIRTACVCTSLHHHNHFHHQQRQGPKPSTLALVNTLRKELVQQQCCGGDAADERLHGHRQPVLHTKGQPSWIFSPSQQTAEQNRALRASESCDSSSFRHFQFFILFGGLF